MQSFFVVGGTGTLGEAFTKRALKDGNIVTCFSRCELKQKELASRLKSSNVRYVVGDIRDKAALKRAMRGHDAVFHFAALKHVDTLEANPEEGFKTNVEGTVNSLDAAEECGVETFVFSSTDKAVDPINAYGFSKALAEKIILAHRSNLKKKIYRWGNVIGSRGSVIPQFVKTLKGATPTAFVTDPEMTRFWIKIEDAVDFMFSSFQGEGRQDVLIPPIKAAPVVSVVKAVAELLGVKAYEQRVIGIRPGEKIHERLLSAHTGAADSSDPVYWFHQEELKSYLLDEVMGVK